MARYPRYSVKQYTFWIVGSATAGLLIAAVILYAIGFPTQGILMVVLLSFPFLLFACLRGFHKGLVIHYGFREPQFDRKEDDKAGHPD